MRLIGVFLSCEAPVGTTTVAAASSRALESAPAVTTELSVCRGLDALGEGPLICSTWGRSVLAVLSLLASACPRGSAGSWTVSAGTLCSRPVLLDSRSQLRSPFCVEPLL